GSNVDHIRHWTERVKLSQFGIELGDCGVTGLQRPGRDRLFQFLATLSPRLEMKSAQPPFGGSPSCRHRGGKQADNEPGRATRSEGGGTILGGNSRHRAQRCYCRWKSGDPPNPWERTSLVIEQLRPTYPVFQDQSARPAGRIELAESLKAKRS